jgi:hypothetical protein
MVSEPNILSSNIVSINSHLTSIKYEYYTYWVSLVKREFKLTHEGECDYSPVSILKIIDTLSIRQGN